MKTAARVLGVFLMIWLIAVPSFPTCCWPLIQTHSHSGSPESAHDHHHQNPERADGGVRLEATQQPAVTPSTFMASIRPGKACVAPTLIALAPTGRAHVIGWARVAVVTAEHDELASPACRQVTSTSYDAPPGSSFPDFAFLNPLRI